MIGIELLENFLGVPSVAERLEFLQGHLAVAIGIHLVEDHLGIGGVPLAPLGGLELVEAQEAVGVGIESLEDLLGIPSVTECLEFLQHHLVIAIGIHFLIDLPGLGRITLAQWRCDEFVAAEEPVAVGVKFLESFLGAWALIPAGGRFDRFVLSERERGGDNQCAEGCDGCFHGVGGCQGCWRRPRTWPQHQEKRHKSRNVSLNVDNLEGEGGTGTAFRPC